MRQAISVGMRVRGVRGAASCRSGGKAVKRDQYHDGYWWVESDDDGHLYCLHHLDLEAA
jgi:hypothetical protein